MSLIRNPSDKKTVSPAPEIAKPQPPKADLISVGVMANVKSDRAVKIDRIQTFDRIVADNPFATPIEGEGKSDSRRSNDDSNQSNDGELASNNSSISRKAALAAVKKYITAKSQLFAPPFDKNLGAELLTGKIYRDKIDKGDSECNNPEVTNSNKIR